MELRELQSNLARAWTDPGVLGPAGDSVERGTKLFSRSLVEKRRGQIAKFLPGFSKYEDFRKHFRAYATSPFPSGTRRYVNDALQFVQFVERDETIPDWWKDLARYEAAILKAATRRWVILPLRFAVEEWGLSEAPARRWTLHCWFRLRQRGRLRRFRLYLP